ncbi:hypothetical protein ACFQU2_22880 [Siccirubricoccus deserti]
MDTGYGRRRVLALAGGMLAAPGLLRAQGAYPSRSVRVINAYSPGGTADVVSASSSPGSRRGSDSNSWWRTGRAPPAPSLPRRSPGRRRMATRCCTTRRRIR